MTEKIYRYHIVDEQGNRVESNIPELTQAYAYLEFLKETQGIITYTIEQEHIPQARGMGRDPDLH
jgi:hypothetical protein